ncbi:MAG: thermonuclease family protein [Planctomycetes bacterium]|nr:thermonuclease family protein [Planctomycetota bacterium]
MAIIAAFALVRLGYDRWRGSPSLGGRPPLSEGLYEVVRVVDGDTLKVRAPDASERDLRSERGVRLRLLGIDCPESVKPNHPVEPWGPEAAEFTTKFIADRPVRLQFDGRRVDQYGRYLAYVFVDERMLNEELVREGLARVSTYPGDSQTMARRLRAAEDEARQNLRGIWSGRSRDLEHDR